MDWNRAYIWVANYCIKDVNGKMTGDVRTLRRLWGSPMSLMRNPKQQCINAGDKEPPTRPNHRPDWRSHLHYCADTEGWTLATSCLYNINRSLHCQFVLLTPAMYCYSIHYQNPLSGATLKWACLKLCIIWSEIKRIPLCVAYIS